MVHAVEVLAAVVSAAPGSARHWLAAVALLQGLLHRIPPAASPARHGQGSWCIRAALHMRLCCLACSLVGSVTPWLPERCEGSPTLEPPGQPAALQKTACTVAKQGQLVSAKNAGAKQRPSWLVWTECSNTKASWSLQKECSKSWNSAGVLGAFPFSRRRQKASGPDTTALKLPGRSLSRVLVEPNPV